MNKWLKIVSVVAIILTVGVVTLFSVVSAQEPTEEDGFSGRRGRGDRGFGPQAGLFQNEDFKALHQEALAEALGISVSALEAAKTAGQSLRELAEAQGIDVADIQAVLAAARQEAINQAVTDGLLTQEQADQLGQGRPGRHQGRPGGPGQAGLNLDEALKEQLRTETQAALAEALGLTVEALEEAKAEGQPLRELAADLGVEMTDVQAAIQAAAQNVFEQAVADGDLTQEEADQLSERFEHSGPGNGHNPRSGPRGNRGGPRGFNGSPDQQ